MEILFIGDIVGAGAARWVGSRVPRLRDELALDWVIVNGENCVVTGPRPNNGFGLSVEIVELSKTAKIGWDHAWCSSSARTVGSPASPQRTSTSTDSLSNGPNRRCSSSCRYS